MYVKTALSFIDTIIPHTKTLPHSITRIKWAKILGWASGNYWYQVRSGSEEKAVLEFSVP